MCAIFGLHSSNPRIYEMDQVGPYTGYKWSELSSGRTYMGLAPAGGWNSPYFYPQKPRFWLDAGAYFVAVF